jgi:transcriptional regulator with XRE-family HTH domain
MHKALPKTPREVCLQLAARLRGRRLQLRMPQEELARRTGLAVGTIKHLESRPWSSSLENLVRAGAALQLNAGFAKLFEWRPASYAETMRIGRAPRLRARRRRQATAGQAVLNCSSSVLPCSAVVEESPAITACVTSSK